MTKSVKKIIAFVMAMVMVVGMIPVTSLMTNADSLSTAVTEPFSSSITFTADGTSHTSNSYRIPSMVTLKDGTIVAAADARYNTTYDGGGLDTLAAYSTDGGVTWNYSAANYWPDNGDSYNAKSTAFLDPSLLVSQDGTRVYMLTDIYPGGVALNGNGSQTTPSKTTTGFDSDGNLMLSKGSSTSYNYYLKNGRIYDYASNTDQGYTVDEYFYVYQDDVKLGNLFYNESSYSTSTTSTASAASIASANSDDSSDRGVISDDSSADQGSAEAGDEEVSSDDEAYVSSAADTDSENSSDIESDDSIDSTNRADVESDTDDKTDIDSKKAADTSNVEDVEDEEEVADDTEELLTASNDAFKVAPTAYLGLIYSDDGGKTWSAPQLLNVKTTSENACLVGPGRGITTSDGLMVFPVYSYGGSNESQRTGFIYSTDGKNWQRADSCDVNWSSEASVVEISGTQTLRFFYRNSTKKLCYVDYDRSTSTWGAVVTTDLSTNSNTQLSAITYSQTADSGKQVILVSAPGGPNGNGSNSSDSSNRSYGRVFVGEVDSDGSMTWKNTISVNSSTFIYSCLTERSDGSVALLYENYASGWGTGAYYTMEMTTYTASDLGVTLDTQEENSQQYVTLEVGDDSNSYTVSDSQEIGEEGWYKSDDGKVAYEISFDSMEEKSSIAAGDTVRIQSGDYWLKINGSNLDKTQDYTEATVWTVATSSTDSTSFYLTSGSYYLNHYNNNLSLRSSASAKNTNWCYSADEGFYYTTWSSGGNYAEPTRYLTYDTTNAAWTYATSADNLAVAYDATDSSGTKVQFIALDTTTTTVTLGGIDYKILATDKSKSISKTLQLDKYIELDAIEDLNLLSEANTKSVDSSLAELLPSYKVSYEVTSNLSGAVTMEDYIQDQSVKVNGVNYGTAEVVGTVTNSTSENVVGQVTYEIDVQDIEITDTKNIYVPVDGTATIQGLEGKVIGTRNDGTDVLDTSIATIDTELGTELSDGSITITGIKEGKTQVLVGTVAFNIYVVNKNESKTDSKYLYVYVDELTHTTVYYTINGSTLRKVEGTGVLVDETFNGGFHLLFFAVPDEGYALTTMEMDYNLTSATGSMTKATDFYCISNGSRADGADSDAWPLSDADATEVPTAPNDSAWKTINNAKHGFRWALIQGNLTLDRMRELFTEALEKGADGATNMTKNGTDGGYYHWTFKSEKLPTLNKTLVSYHRDGVEYDYVSGETVLQFGDILDYQFDITSYSSNINYTGITLKDDPIGWNTTLTDNALDKVGVYSYTASYTVTRDDLSKYLGGTFTNVAELNYTYSSTFSAGSKNEQTEASIDAPIAGVVGYSWPEDIPDGIKKDTVNYPLPDSKIVAAGDIFEVEKYQGKTTYDVVENGITKGTWNYKGWWNWKDTEYKGGEKVTMPEQEAVDFIGEWEYTPAAQYSVTYSWADSDTVPSTAKLPTDGNSYYKAESYEVNGNYYDGFTYEDDSYTYTFHGWKIDGEGDAVSGSQTMGDANIRLVGSWTKVAKTTSLTLKKTGIADEDADQTILFQITGRGVDGDLSMTVSLHGNDSLEIDGLIQGQTYTITEISDWSWRYSTKSWSFNSADSSKDATGDSEAAEIRLGTGDNVLTFTNQKEKTSWLDGNSHSVNIFNESAN